MGIVENLSFADYQQIDRMNASTLVHGIKSMKQLKCSIDGGGKEASDAMRFGNHYHSLILEPEDFERLHCVMPNFAEMPENTTGKGCQSKSWATTFCKESIERFENENVGREIITRENYDRALAMCEAIRDHKLASELLAGSKKEVTLLGEIGGVEMKCRIDIVGESMIADLKGTGNVLPFVFGSVAARLHYPFKLAIYRELFRQNFAADPSVYVIAVETNRPFDVAVYSISDNVLDFELLNVKKVLAKFAEASKRNEWPGVCNDEEAIELAIPNWALPEDEVLDWSGVA